MLFLSYIFYIKNLWFTKRLTKFSFSNHLHKSLEYVKGSGKFIGSSDFLMILYAMRTQHTRLFLCLHRISVIKMSDELIYISKVP